MRSWIGPLALLGDLELFAASSSIRLPSGFREQVLAARTLHQFRQSLGFRARNSKSKISKSIIPPTLIVQFRIGPFVSFFDHAIGQHSLDRSVKRAWPETHFALGTLIDFLHDVITVP